jgi:YHS domain-containing protein
MWARSGGLLILLVFSLCAVGSTTVMAQSPNGNVPHLSLKGYDPVAYFLLGRPARGNPKIETVFDGSRYRFVSVRHKRLFLADPDRYAPQFAGACARGVSMGMKIEANPYVWRIVDGRLYVFSSKKVMPANIAPVIQNARVQWKNVKAKSFK